MPIVTSCASGTCCRLGPGRVLEKTGMVNTVGQQRMGLAAAMVAWSLLPAAASGQLAEPMRPETGVPSNRAKATRYSPVSRTDAYGNARSPYEPIRETSLFLDAGLTNGFAGGLTSQLLGLSRLPTRSPRGDERRLDPVAGLASSALGGNAWQRRAFASYGGFERRGSSARTSDLSVAFERRYALVAATGLNAPVHRASMRPGSRSYSSSALSRQPFVVATTPPEVEVGVPLGDWLGDTNRQAYARSRAQADAAFREGEYRRAVSAYQTAVMLEPSDVRARVGELFCYLSLGSFATAVVTSAELSRRPENPFLPDVDLTGAFGDDADLLRIRSQAFVDGAAEPGPLALRTLALWYLGERDEAARVARLMPRGRSAGSFVDWAARLEAARAAVGTPKKVPN